MLGKRTISSTLWKGQEQGFSMVEALVAIAMLSGGVLGLVSLIPFVIKNDYRTRIDTTATFVASRELEQMLAQPFATASFVDAPDDAAVPTTATVNLSAGGATLNSSGNIDFTQAYSAVTAGYKRTYMIGASGVANNVEINADSYDLRWHISVTNGIQTITIAARQLNPKPGAINIPVNILAVRMK